MSLMAYDSYRKSNLEWLDEVPDHWEHKKIAWDLPYVVGWTPPSGKDEFYDGEHPWVTIADMTRGNIEDTQSKITDAAIEAKKAEIVPAGSMLFSFKLSVGKVAFLKIDSYTNEAIAAFRPTSGISLEFWKYAAPEIIPHYGRENIYGAKLLNQELIGSARFYCPPVEEQAQIARFLDHETAKIDALIREQERLIELLQEKRQAVISHAVTKGLDPDVPMKDSGVEWLGEVPVHWEMVPLKYLCSFSGGGTPSKENLEYWNGDIPWVSPKDMKSFWISNSIDKITELAVAESSTSLVEPNALLMVVRSGILQRTIPVAVNTVGVTLNQDMKALRFSMEGFERYFAMLVQGFEPSWLLEWRKQGATVESIEQEYLAESLIPVPPRNEIYAIVNKVAAVAKRYESLEEEAHNSSQFLRERRSALISAAVTGKIDVRNWQPPADESAFDKEVRQAGMEATA